MKPATGKERKLLTKLTALAERGVNGERDNAIEKLAELKSNFDFSGRDNSEANLFAGTFYPAPGAANPVREFDAAAMAWACQIKWALEHATGIRCAFRGNVLVSEARPETARRLGDIAATIYTGFNSLWAKYLEAPATNRADLPAFRMGLYDGMMGEVHALSQRLPNRLPTPRAGKPKRRALGPPAGITPHPYTVAARLGELIRFETPLADITAELETLTAPQLAA